MLKCVIKQGFDVFIWVSALLVFLSLHEVQLVLLVEKNLQYKVLKA